MARIFATTASFRADPAVAVHFGVPFAFVSTGLAHGGAGLQNSASDVRVVAGVTGEDISCGGADVRTIKVSADALGQLGDHVFAQARICAGGAGLRAVKGRGDTFGELVLVDAAKILRVGIKHFVDAGVCHQFLSFKVLSGWK